MKKPRPPAKRSPQPSNGNHTHISLQAHKWEAPLPPPSVLQEYNTAAPNGAERIVKNWEIESVHRREREKDEQRLHYRDAREGRYCALAFVLFALAVSAFFAYLKQPWLAGILGGGTIASVVWAFVYRQKPRQKT